MLNKTLFCTCIKQTKIGSLLLTYFLHYFFLKKNKKNKKRVSTLFLNMHNKFIMRIIFVGPEIWSSSPLYVKGPKPCPIKPNRLGRAMQLHEGPRTWPRTTSHPTSHKSAWRKVQIQYKSNSREKAANTLMRSPAPDKPILTPCYPAFPNHSDVRIDKTSNCPKQGQTDT